MTSEYVKSKLFVSRVKYFAALEPCLMGFEMPFYFLFSESEAESSLSSSDTCEKYFSAWACVRLFFCFGAGVDLVVV